VGKWADNLNKTMGGSFLVVGDGLKRVSQC